MFDRKKHHLSQSVTALLLALLLVIGAMPLTPALAQVAEGTEAAQEGIEALEENTAPAVVDTEVVIPAEESAPKTLTVLHTNDMHGALVSSGTSTIGADETPVSGQLPRKPTTPCCWTPGTRPRAAPWRP